MGNLATSEIIGKNIRFLRLKLGLTQAQLADELNINSRRLGKIETGERYVTIPLLDKLSIFFNKPQAYFFILSEDQSEDPSLKSAFELAKSTDPKTQRNIIKMINILTGVD